MIYKFFFFFRTIQKVVGNGMSEPSTSISQLGGGTPLASKITHFSHIFQPFNLGDPSGKSRCKMGTLCKKANARATALLHCTICKRFGCQLSHSCCTWNITTTKKTKIQCQETPQTKFPLHFFCRSFWGREIYLQKKTTPAD